MAAAGAAVDKGGLPMGQDQLLFDAKPPEEQKRLLRRREEALVQNKVLRAIARRGLNLREAFELMDADGSGEIDAEEFISGIQAFEGQLTDGQCRTLMERVDADGNGEVDFSELTRALQKLDLRVEMHDYLIVCVRFFIAEMHRTVQLLRRRFEQAVKEKGKGGDDSGGDDGGEGGEAALSADGVRTLLKSLDAPFTSSTLPRVLGEMVRSGEASWAESGGGSGKRKGGRTAEASVNDNGAEAIITADAFVRACMDNGFHSVAHPAFKEMGVQSAANAMMAVSMFTGKLRTEMRAAKKKQETGDAAGAPAPAGARPP